MKPLAEIQEHMLFLEKLGTVRKNGKKTVMDYNQMSIRFNNAASNTTHKEGESFDRHFLNGFYEALSWVMETPKPEWEIVEAYKLVDQSIITMKPKKGDKDFLKERHKMIGERNAFGFALDWSLTPAMRHGK